MSAPLGLPQTDHGHRFLPGTLRLPRVTVHQVARPVAALKGAAPDLVRITDDVPAHASYSDGARILAPLGGSCVGARLPAPLIPEASPASASLTFRWQCFG